MKEVSRSLSRQKFSPRTRGFLTEIFHPMVTGIRHVLHGLLEEERKTVMVGRYYRNCPKPMTWAR